MCTFTYTFFTGRYHTSRLSTDARFFLFPTILVAQVLVGAMGNTPPMCMVHGVGDISVVILSCWILYICVWGPGRDFAPLHRDYTSSSLLFLGSYLHSFSTTLFLWGESGWTDMTLRCALTSPTFMIGLMWRSDVHWLHRHLHRFWIYYALFLARTSKCGFLLSGILHGATFFI
jgi:hypothetical protein